MSCTDEFSAPAGVLGQRPAVLARQVGQQPTHVLASLRDRLHPGEVRTHAPDQLGEFLRDLPALYHGRSGHPTIFICPHNT
jgi:hypothetical protein